MINVLAIGRLTNGVLWLVLGLVRLLVGLILWVGPKLRQKRLASWVSYYTDQEGQAMTFRTTCEMAKRKDAFYQRYCEKEQAFKALRFAAEQAEGAWQRWLAGVEGWLAWLRDLTTYPTQWMNSLAGLRKSPKAGYRVAWSDALTVLPVVYWLICLFLQSGLVPEEMKEQLRELVSLGFELLRSNMA